MEYSNLYFLFILLPLTMLFYFLMPSMRLKNAALLGISMLFYAMGQPLYLIFMIGISYVNYLLSKRIKAGDKWSIALPVAIDLHVQISGLLFEHGGHRGGSRRGDELLSSDHR